MLWIDRFLQSATEFRNKNPKHVVFMSVDPSGSGRSEMCIVSMTLIRGQATVIAIDLQKQNGAEEIERILTTHVESVRLRPQFRDSQLICFFESNLGNEADYMRRMLEPYPRVWHWEEDNGKLGVLTTNARKEQFAAEGVKHLATGSISLWKDLLLPNPYDSAPEKKKRLLKKLKLQLLAFERIVKPNKYRKPTLLFSGKGENGDTNDDFVLALLINLYFASLWCSRKSRFPYETLPFLADA
jgi:hypothetical protein